MRNKILNVKESTITKLTVALLFISFIASGNIINATGTQPKLISGTAQLFKTATGWLLVLIPVGCGFILGYHALQKALTDDDAVIADKNKKMKNVLINGAIGMTASGLVNIVLGFYK